MPQATRDIKRRIKSIGNTKKITKALELVSAAKMRKAVSHVLSSRSYAGLAWAMAKRLAEKTDVKYHALLAARLEVKKIGLILVTSNRGLCGGFNAQIIHKVSQFIKYQQEKVGIEADLVIMGKRGREVMFKHGQTIIAEFNKLDITTAIEEIRPLSKLVIADYLAGQYDKVVVAYTDFISTLVQKPRILQILPIRADQTDEFLGEVGVDRAGDLGGSEKIEPNNNFADLEYKFEPSPKQVLEDLLPRLMEMQIYQAILESDASEHSARMVAMRNASDAASDMISDLTLSFNKARQASITAELADISGGRAAVE